jgi:hypothetical protein
MHAVVAGKCTYSSRICEAFTTLSATDEHDFVALLVALVSGWVEPCHESEANDAHLLFLSFSCLAYCQVKARLYDTALGYDIIRQTTLDHECRE